MRSVRFGIVFLLSLLLMGCVSTSGMQTRRIDPDKAVDTRIELGMRYLEAGNRDQALRQFLDVLDVNKKNPLGLQGLALVHQTNGEPEQAEEAFRKGIKYAGKEHDSTLRYRYAIFLSRQKRYAEALTQFDIVSKDLSFEHRASSLYFLGRCATELGNQDRAKAAFTHALNLRPSMGSAALELADIAFKNQDYAEAKAQLDQFNRLSKPSARSLWLGIRIERIFENKDKIASQALVLKNLFGYSKEYLEYKRLMGNE